MRLPFLTQNEINSLNIERMIFHAVGPEDDSLQLLDAEVPTTFSDFFLERVKAALSGLQFDFMAGSPVQAALTTIDGDRNRFVEQSKVIATLFHQHHTRNTSKGALVLIVLTSSSGTIYALLKFDNENVLSYTITDQNGKLTANISALEETLTKSREALQKSAIIRLTESGGELSLKDRSSPGDITHYFRTFLLVQRRFQPSDLTKKIAEIAREAANANAATLNPEVLRNIRSRIHDAVQTLPGYDPESREFVNAVYGAVTEDSPVVRDFHRKMRQAHIDEEEFQFDRSAVPRPPLRRIVTNENIQIIFDRNQQDLVRVVDLNGGRKRITIETRGLKENDDYTETTRRRD